MKNSKLYIGLDVHKNSIVVATASEGRSKPVHYGKWGGSNLSAERGLARLRTKLGVAKEDIRIAYEAGPTGFVLARRLLQLGYDCILVAPSEVPRKAGQRVRTDRRDARKLAGLLRAGELEGIHIPEPRDEAVRDLCRVRTDASEALARAKQQLGMFLLRNGIRYDGKTRWSQGHMNYLRRQRMPHLAQQIVLEEYIQAVDEGVERVLRIEAHMHEALQEWERKPYVEALMAFRGFKTVAAMTEVAELGDLSRFGHPRQLMGYLGVVPGEDSTGERRRQGAITKTGNGHARWMLIDHRRRSRGGDCRRQPEGRDERSERVNAPPITFTCPGSPRSFQHGKKARAGKCEPSPGVPRTASTTASRRSPPGA